MTSINLSDWVGRAETVHDELARAQVLAAAAMFDDPMLTQSSITAIPPLWHWFYFLPRAAQPRLSDDGHPERGNFMPPVPLPRRMFAGARVQFRSPLQPSHPARRDGEIRKVSMKEGKSGRLAFVTVGYSIWQDDRLCIEEEQDIVYREPGAAVAPLTRHSFPNAPTDAWLRDLEPDTRLLFRFSALTFNAHRIHYDREYAMQEEGYPGLVVHGPLNAMLLANLVREHTDRPITSFSFRGLAPVFDRAPIRLLARPLDDVVECSVLRADGQIAMEATVTLGAASTAIT